MRYADLLENPNHRDLSDAGKEYSPGENQIWYVKDAYFRDFSGGYKNLKKQAPYFDVDDLEKTHVLLGSLAENNPDQIYALMQGEAWSPSGEARGFLTQKGLGHTSMHVGDIIATPTQKIMVDRLGFIDLETGSKPVIESLDENMSFASMMGTMSTIGRDNQRNQYEYEFLKDKRAMDFVPNENAIQDAIESLRKLPGGGIATPDDMRFEANKRKHNEIFDSNAWRFWEAVYKAI